MTPAEPDLVAAVRFPVGERPDDPVPEPADDIPDPVLDTAPGLPGWEYKAVLGGAGSKDATERLNVLGARGWELVGVEPPQAGGQTVFYLKRPAGR